MILKHCAGPLKDWHQNRSMRVSFDLLHGEVIACKNFTHAPDSGLWNGILVVILHTPYELPWVTEKIYPSSFKIPTSVSLDFVNLTFLWLVLHHVACNLHTQNDCWCWNPDLGKDVEVILLELLKNTFRLIKQWFSLF